MLIGQLEFYRLRPILVRLKLIPPRKEVTLQHIVRVVLYKFLLCVKDVSFFNLVKSIILVKLNLRLNKRFAHFAIRSTAFFSLACGQRRRSSLLCSRVKRIRLCQQASFSSKS